jgi:hypothetical protein
MLEGKNPHTVRSLIYAQTATAVNITQRPHPHTGPKNPKTLWTTRKHHIIGAAPKMKNKIGAQSRP